MWTLVGAGIKKVDQSGMPMDEVLPKYCVHYKQSVSEFDPDHNTVTLSNGQKVRRQFEYTCSYASYSNVNKSVPILGLPPPFY